MEKQKRSYFVISAVAAIAILAGAAVFVMTLFGATNEEPEAIFGDDGVTIVGQYGETYLYTDILNVTLEQSIPKVGSKSNGAGLGEVKKGDWEVEGLGTCRLFIMSDAGPYVITETKSGYVIINYEDQDKTKALYENLLKY